MGVSPETPARARKAQRNRSKSAPPTFAFKVSTEYIVAEASPATGAPEEPEELTGPGSLQDHAAKTTSALMARAAAAAAAAARGMAQTAVDGASEARSTTGEVSGNGELDVDISAGYVVPDGAEKPKIAVDPHAHLLRDSPIRAPSRNWHPTKPNLRRVHNPASHRSILSFTPIESSWEHVTGSKVQP
eukprot:FR740132.1.p1 GENE.FR740132.1~~FR740132.1.p1  ORF type:complete len:188 (-),score=3.43 FR740132.1:176-739(-)